MAAGYGTPAALAAAYEAVASPAEGERLLAAVDPPPGRARVSATVSAYLYRLFCADSYGTRLL